MRRVEGKWGRTVESEREMAVRGRREDECAKSVERRRCRVSMGSYSGACWTSVSVSTVEPPLVTKPAGPGRMQLRLLHLLSPAPLGSRVKRGHVAGACTVPKTLRVAEGVAQPAATPRMNLSTIASPSKDARVCERGSACSGRHPVIE